MSSVYNAWRKTLTLKTRFTLSQSQKIYTSVSPSHLLFTFVLAFFLWVSSFILVFWNLLNLDNHEQWGFFCLLFDSLNLNLWKPQDTKNVPLTTQIPNNIFRCFPFRRNVGVWKFKYGRKALRSRATSSRAAGRNFVAKIDIVGSSETAQQSGLQFITHIIINVLQQLLRNYN